MKRDMVNQTEADEVRERVGVFLVEKPGKDTQRLIIDARVSNLHFLHPPGVSLVTSEGLSRVEVALENDAPVFAAYRWVTPGVYFSAREQSMRQCGPHPALTKQRFSRTHGAAQPSSDERNDAESSRRAPKKFFYVYVDNLGILGTARVNVDEDLRLAVQTLKSRGLDTHDEIVHSDTAIALGIYIDLRNMLVSVAPTRLWRLKQGLRWAPRCRALPGKTWEVLLGHTTFVALVRRDVLSVLFAVNKFIRANYDDSARLWPSARADVQAVVALLPAIVSSWTRGGCSSIVATDASEYGFGVCLKECKNMSVKSSDGQANEHDSANAIMTLLMQARRSKINIGSDLTLVVTWLI